MTRLWFSNNIILSLALGTFLILAAGFLGREKLAEAANTELVSLLVNAPGEKCIDSNTLGHEEKLNNGIEEDRVYFVGCGGFF